VSRIKQGEILRINFKSVLAQVGIVLIVYALPLFLPRGLRAWPAGWIFLGLWFGFWLVMLGWLYRHNPALFQERVRVTTTDQKKLGQDLYSPDQCHLVCVAAFYLFRCAALALVNRSNWLQALGTIILLGSFVLFFLTFRENSFLSPVCTTPGRARTNRNFHRALCLCKASDVCCDGAGCDWRTAPAGCVVWSPGGLIFVLVLARRAVLEESTLKQELSGYAEYMERVKYRLIPNIW